MDVKELERRGFKPGAIVYPYGSPTRLGIIREVRDTRWDDILVEWVKPKKDVPNPTWTNGVCLLDELRIEAERKAETHNRNLKKAKEFFGVS